MASTPDAAERVFTGRMVGVTLERWDDAEREVVERADSIAVVAVEPSDSLLLVRQFRAPARRALLELPAGTVDEGEEPLETAKRELAEETGLRGGRWRAGPAFYTTPGFCRERIHLFFADELERGEPTPERSEELEVIRWPLTDAASRLAEVEDAKTLAGILLFLARA